MPRTALVLVLAAGCSLSLDFGGLTGGADAGTPGTDAGVDVAADTTAAESGAKHFCSSLSPQPTFCADFDATELVPPFDALEAVSGRPRKDLLVSLSPPASMLAETVPVGSGGRVESFVHKSFAAFTGRPVTLDLGADVRIEQTDETNGAEAVILAMIVYRESNPRNHLDLNVGHDGANVRFTLVEHDGSRVEVYRMPTRVPKNQWARLRLQLRLTNPSGANNAASVFIGDRQDFNSALLVPFNAGIPRVLVGVPFAGTPSGAWVIRYDNVVADLR